MRCRTSESQSVRQLILLCAYLKSRLSREKACWCGVVFGKNRYQRQDKKTKWPVSYECSNSNRRFTCFFDAQSRSWDSRMIRDPDLLRCLLAWLPLQSGDSVLDVGTGTGVLLPYIREIAPQGEIDAVDISPGMLAVAQDKYGGDAHIHFISADVSKYATPSLSCHYSLLGVSALVSAR